jgi:hypothetical protein
MLRNTSKKISRQSYGLQLVISVCMFKMFLVFVLQFKQLKNQILFSHNHREVFVLVEDLYLLVIISVGIDSSLYNNIY